MFATGFSRASRRTYRRITPLRLKPAERKRASERHDNHQLKLYANKPRSVRADGFASANASTTIDGLLALAKPVAPAKLAVTEPFG